MSAEPELSPASTYVEVQSGGNLVVGTGAALTSLEDDARGGDTNADGAATTPATDDWMGVWVSGLGSGYTDYAYTHYDQFGP